MFKYIFRNYESTNLSVHFLSPTQPISKQFLSRITHQGVIFEKIVNLGPWMFLAFAHMIHHTF